MNFTKYSYKAEKAAEALTELGTKAIENGTSEMSLDEINAEIEAARNTLNDEFQSALDEAQIWANQAGYNEGDVDNIIKSVRSRKKA